MNLLTAAPRLGTLQNPDLPYSSYHTTLPGIFIKYRIAALAVVMLGTVVAIVMLGVASSTWATITTITPTGERIERTQQEFASYVEHVFRLQNQVGTDLIDHYEMSGYSESDTSSELPAAEASMDESCRNLIELVTLRMENREPSLALMRNMVNTIAACDYDTRHVANLVNSGRSNSEQVVIAE